MKYRYLLVECAPAENEWHYHRIVCTFDNLPAVEEVKAVCEKHDVLFTCYAIMLQPVHK